MASCYRNHQASLSQAFSSYEEKIHYVHRNGTFDFPTLKRNLRKSYFPEIAACADKGSAKKVSSPSAFVESQISSGYNNLYTKVLLRWHTLIYFSNEPKAVNPQTIYGMMYTRVCMCAHICVYVDMYVYVWCTCVHTHACKTSG